MLRTLFLSALFVLSTPALAQEKSKVGIPTNTAGWSFQDPATGDPVGIAVDMAHGLAASVGPVEIVPLPFAQLIPELVAGRIDIISANLTVTPERERQVAFSTPFFVGADGLVVPASNLAALKSWDDLKGRTMGTFAGSIYVQPMRDAALFSDVKTFASPDELVAAVDGGVIDAGIGPGVSLGYLVAQGKFKNVRFVRTYEPRFKSNIAIAVRKDDGMRLAQINARLGEMRSDGTLKTIFSKWGQ